MKKILLLGAGRSSSSLISYLLKECATHDWQLVVGDSSLVHAEEKVRGHAHGKAILFDIEDDGRAAEVIRQGDVVISLLPPHFHPVVARHCLTHHKHLFTASYVSPEMQSFHEETVAKGLLFLNECGLDPGIDHMSAVQVMDKIRDEHGTLLSFESFTGGLIAPETDPGNPWRYKFTWNPRNVVMAGQGTAKYLQNGRYKFIPYQQLFQRTTTIHVPGYGDFEGYANRDSLKYIDTYKLHGIQTMLRGTLRNKGFCGAWNLLVQLGCCDDTYILDGVETMTHHDFLETFVETKPGISVEQTITSRFSIALDSPEMERLRWSGLFTSEQIGLTTGTPAQLLEHILNKKWQLQPHDKDLIVMWHRFVYTLNGKQNEIQATLVAKGDDSVFTAMSKTVGLPLAIAAKLMLLEKIKLRGVAIPVSKEIYDPILEELKVLGIELEERHIA